MGNDREAVAPSVWRALAYEALLWAAGKWPKLARSPWFKMALAHCFQHWLAWKTKLVMRDVDAQAEQIKEQWEKQERQEQADALAAKAEQLFPDATVEPLPDALVPSVLIEHPAPSGASPAVQALGGEMRITYHLPE